MKTIRENAPLIINNLKNRQRELSCPNLYGIVDETIELITILLEESKDKEREIESLYITHNELTRELKKCNQLINALINEADEWCSGINNSL